MMESAMSERLEMRWVPVVDASGRTRMEASWIPVSSVGAQSAAHAA